MRHRIAATLVFAVLQLVYACAFLPGVRSWWYALGYWALVTSLAVVASVVSARQLDKLWKAAFAVVLLGTLIFVVGFLAVEAVYDPRFLPALFRQFDKFGPVALVRAFELPVLLCGTPFLFAATYFGSAVWGRFVSTRAGSTRTGQAISQ